VLSFASVPPLPPRPPPPSFPPPPLSLSRSRARALSHSLTHSLSLTQGSDVNPLQSSLCGSLSGGFSAAVTTPLDVVKTRLMLGKDKDGVAYRGPSDAIKRIYAEGGATRFFSGLSLSLVPNACVCVGGCVGVCVCVCVAR
jgi:hypothetical protein